MEGAVAIISGRRIADIDRLLAPLRLAAAGVHGAEFRAASAAPIRQITEELPATLRVALSALASEPGILVEDKGLAVAVHYRLATPAVAERVRGRALAAASGTPGVSVLEGKCLVEFKLQGASKGVALEQFMSLPPFKGRRPVFAGDDVTDEDAFARLPAWTGVGICIGQPRKGAQVQLPDPAAVRAWLSAVASGQRGETI
jgi:trehalose 6-phosphate phosphatase